MTIPPSITSKERIERRFRRFKQQGRALSLAFDIAASRELRISEWRWLSTAAQRLSSCAFNLRLVEHQDRPFSPKLANERSCKIRLCSFCEMRRSSKLRRQVDRATSRIFQLQPGTRVLALTLTAANEPLVEDGLFNMLEAMDRAFGRLVKQEAVSGVVKGYLASFETPIRGSQASPEAGVHIHALLFVGSDYYSRPIAHATWRMLWRDALRVAYLPMVHIKAADRATDGDDAWAIRSSIGEAIKYAVKPASIFTKTGDKFYVDPDIAVTVAKGLKGRRLVRHGGIVSRALRNIKQQEALMDGC